LSFQEKVLFYEIISVLYMCRNTTTMIIITAMMIIIAIPKQHKRKRIDPMKKDLTTYIPFLFMQQAVLIESDIIWE